MGLFSSKPPQEPKPIIINLPIIEPGFIDDIIDLLKKDDKRDVIYKNYSDDDDCDMTYIDSNDHLYSNYRMIQTYRNHKTLLIEPKNLKKIILKKKLEIGFLNNMSFPITKLAKRKYDNTRSDIKYYGSKNYKLAKILNLIGFEDGYSEKYGFNTNNCDYRENILEIVPCYDMDALSNTDSNDNYDKYFILGKNLQFNGVNIIDEKMVSAVICSYNPLMKMFTILQDAKWYIDNRPEKEKALKFHEYIDLEKHKYEPLVDISFRL